jgi:hypothetical protein
VKVKVKILSLDNMILYLGEEYFLDCSMKEIEPVFNRNGRYYDRLNKKAWYEWNGKAFLENRIDDFIYEFNNLSVRILSKEEFSAFKLLRKSRFLTKNQKDILHINENLLDRKESKLRHYKWLKKNDLIER